MCTEKDVREVVQQETNRIKYDLKRDLYRIEGKVDHINGTVKLHEGRIRDAEEDLRHPEDTCPFKEDISTFSRFLDVETSLKEYLDKEEERRYKKVRKMGVILGVVLTGLFAFLSFLFDAFIRGI